jgi:hypothetical protein
MPITLKFNRLANNFHILDQISESLPEFYLLPEYKDALKHEFLDKELLGKYREIRKKHQIAPDALTIAFSNGNLFAPNPQELIDPILDAFFTSESIDQALSKLVQILTEEEISIISQAFKKYEPIFKRLEMTDTSAMTHNLNLLNANIDNDKIDSHLISIRSFYNAPPKDFTTVLLLWYPLSTGFTGCAYRDHLIIRTSGKEIPDSDIVKMLVSVIVHEATHHASSYASTEQKLRLSEIFQSKIDIKNLPHFLNAIEEPLVLALQMVFLKNSYPEIFERNPDWFNEPMAIKIFPLVEKYFNAKQVIDAEFIETCAMALAESRQSLSPRIFG